jgi:hypothetical protein
LFNSTSENLLLMDPLEAARIQANYLKKKSYDFNGEELLPYDSKRRLSNEPITHIKYINVSSS